MQKIIKNKILVMAVLVTTLASSISVFYLNESRLLNLTYVEDVGDIYQAAAIWSLFLSLILLKPLLLLKDFIAKQFPNSPIFTFVSIVIISAFIGRIAYISFYLSQIA